MRLTTHTDYALRVLVFLAVAQRERVRVSEIAQAYNISRHHMAKVVGELQLHGFVSTVRGKNGGVSLAHPVQAISIGEVVRRLEGTDYLVECFSPTNQCVITGACALPAALSEAVEGFMVALDRYSLADITCKHTLALRDALNLGWAAPNSR